LAQRVLEHGHCAVVTARRADQISDIVADYAETALAIALDVNDHAQVDAAIARAGEKFGAIDVLVNNAGYGYLAAVEEGDDREVRDMFETNFFSLVALIRKVLPGMRAHGSGHVINISSVGGLVGAASSGFYNATKFAVEGLTEALAKEVEPLGIRVTAIEPGPFRTDWAGRSLKQAEYPIAAYADTATARRAQITGYSGKQAGDPVRAADAIIKVVESDDPPHNLILGKNGLDRVRAKLAALMQSIDDWEDVTLSADYPDA
jgi:NAD(P)-dependent dehydrogenase (short-subunit alcohol dehydrogenase family)